MINKCDTVDGKENKAIICIKVLKLIDQYWFLIFDPKNTKYSKFGSTIKSKLYEFKNESDFNSEKELKMLSAKLLIKYYGEDWHSLRCCAYKADNTLCKKIITNDKSKHFCGIHVVNYSRKNIKNFNETYRKWCG